MINIKLNINVSIGAFITSHITKYKNAAAIVGMGAFTAADFSASSIMYPSFLASNHLIKAMRPNCWGNDCSKTRAGRMYSITSKVLPAVLCWYFSMRNVLFFLWFYKFKR